MPTLQPTLLFLSLVSYCTCPQASAQIRIVDVERELRQEKERCAVLTAQLAQAHQDIQKV